MSTPEPFTKHFHPLVALVTHLSNTQFESRTVPGMARDLNLDDAVVRAVLEAFSSFFRRSQRTDDSGEHYYTVHLRYARRLVDGEHAPTAPLQPQELGTIFSLIATMVNNESQLADLRQGNWTMLVTMMAALIAAAASIVAALIKH